MRPARRRALLCALVALFVGSGSAATPSRCPAPIRDAFVEEDRALRAEVVETIKDNFYKPIDEGDARRRLAQGIVESLDDQYSHYLTPDEAKQFQESVSGEFEGVGMNVEEDRRGLKVLRVFDGSPARRAGIGKGDLILAVNGRSIAGVNSEVATGRIKGPAGTRVELEVFTPGGRSPRTVRVERARIEVPVASGRIVERDGHKIGVVELISFSSGAHGAAARAQIDKVLDKGAEAIVLDLRGNGGGLLSEAVLVSSIFIEDGEIVSVRGRARPERSRGRRGRRHRRGHAGGRCSWTAAARAPPRS